MAQEVDAAFVADRLKDGVPVINVLTTEAFDQLHIPGSFNAPVGRPGFDEAVQRFAPDKEKPVIVHCSNPGCHSSSKAARKMEAMGYRQVLHYGGGIEEWSRQGRPTDSKQEKVKPPGDTPPEDGQVSPPRTAEHTAEGRWQANRPSGSQPSKRHRTHDGIKEDQRRA